MNSTVSFFLFIFSLFFYDFSFFSFLLFSSFFLWNLRLFFIFCHFLFLFSSSFFSRIFTSPFFFFGHSLSLCFFLRLDRCHWDWPLPWSLASPMRSTSGDACKFHLLFFFFGCGFHVIVGGGGVGLISCDLGCINGVDSSLHFILFC